MKMSTLNFVLSAFITMISFTAVQAQYKYASNTTSSFESEVIALEGIIELAGYNIVSYDVVTLKEGEFFNWDLSCVGGRNYKIYTYIESGIRDVSLNVYDANGKYIEGAKRTGLENTYLTNFNANLSTSALLQAVNNDGKRKYKKYKIAIIVAYAPLKNTYLRS